MKNSRRFGLLLFLFILALLVGVVYIRTEMFQVKTIVVTGNQQTGYEK